MRLSIYLGLILFVSIPAVYRCQEQTELIIYFTDPGQIVKVHLHHMNFTTLPLENLPAPDAIDFDEQNEHLYWTDTVLKQIRRSGPEGENDTVVLQLSNSSNPSGLTVDSSSGLIFYADSGEKKIGKIMMDSFERTVIVDTDLYQPEGIVAHTKNKRLFWVDQGGDEKLRSCDYDGNNQRVITDTGAMKPHGIALDQMEGRLYWADGAGHVKSVLMNGTGLKTTYSEKGVVFNDITVFNGYLYLTMINSFFLVAVPVDGSHLAILSSRRFKYPNGIHAFSPNFNITNVCENFKYGSQCVQCGNCIGDHMCEKTTGICVAGCKAGYQAEMCHDTCEDGTWGESCSNKCGKCLTGTVCDIYTGNCPSGCRMGYKGPKCDQACGRNTYGNPCQDCGNCLGGDPCDWATGRCPSGCLVGWTGDRCDKACSANTYGQCKPCGHCAHDAPCDRNNGLCKTGCAKGYKGARCDLVDVGDRNNSSGLAIGLGVGIAVIILLVIVGILVFFCIRKRRAGEPALPTVKMQRNKDGGDERQENDYTTIETMGTTAIIGADELSQQKEIEYHNVVSTA